MSVILGAIVFIAATSAVIATAAIVSARLYPTRPWSRMLATATLAIVEVLVVSQVLGAIGFLGPVPLAVVVFALLAAAVVVRARNNNWRASKRLYWPLPVWPTLVLCAFALGVLAISLGRPSTGLDTLQYHYPLVAHWMETGNMTEPATLGIGMYAWFYPSNVELLHHWMVVFIGRDLLVSLVSWVFFGFAIGAIAGVVRRLGTGMVTAAFTGLAFVTVPLVLGTQLRSGQVDIASTAFFAMAVFFALGVWKSQRFQDAALAGASLGLAAGSKLVTLPYAAFLGVLFCVVLIVAARRGRMSGRVALQMFGLTAAGTFVTGAFFYLRNLVVVGNPAFPTPLPGFAEAWFPIDFDIASFSVSDYVLSLDPHPWIVAPWLLGIWIAGILALAALVAVPLLLWRAHKRDDPGERIGVNDEPPTTGQRPSDDGGSGLAVATRPPRVRTPTQAARAIDLRSALVVGWIIPLGLFALYLLTPTSAGGPDGYPLLFAPNMRYSFAFLAFALIGLAVALETVSPKAARWLLGTIVVLNTIRMGLGLIGAPSTGPLPTVTVLAGFGLGALATAVGAGTVLLATRWRRVVAADGSPKISPRVLHAGGAVVVAVAILSGTAAAYYFTTDNRYGFSGQEQGIAHKFVQEVEDDSDVTIAHATFPPIYPLYGSRLQNRVVLAADYDTDDTPGVAIPFESEDQLLDFVAAEDADYLVVWDVSFTEWLTQHGVSDEATDEIVRALDTFDPHEAEWALDHPERFRLLDRDGDVYIFEVVG